MTYVSMSAYCQLSNVYSHFVTWVFQTPDEFSLSSLLSGFSTLAESSWVKQNEIISGGKPACVQARNFCTQTEL